MYTSCTGANMLLQRGRIWLKHHSLFESLKVQRHFFIFIFINNFEENVTKNSEMLDAII